LKKALVLSRRQIMAVTASVLAGRAQAQSGSYPDRPIKVILPAAPGGILDQVGRIMGKGFQEVLGSPLVIDHRAGAGGRIGTDVVMKSAPDGYSLLLSANGTLTYVPAVDRRGNFDPLRDLTPLSLVGSYNLIMVVHPSVPANSVKEFIAYARSNPGRINYASTGQASGLHFAGEVFKSMAGIEMTHVPYKGATPALQDVLANNCQMMFAPGNVLAQVEAGKVRALGTTTLFRDPRLPNVPTISESGVPGYDIGSWIAFLGPQRLPKEVRDKLANAMKTVLADADVRNQLGGLGISVLDGSPSQLEALMKTETAKVREIAIRLKIDPET